MQSREASPQQLHVHQMKQTGELNSGSLRALRAMRCNFVATGSPRLGAADVSSHRSTMCHLLSSGGIARPRWYYETIRLPMRDVAPPLFYNCWRPLPSVEAPIGPPGLPRCLNVMHAMVSDPGAQAKPGQYSAARVDFRFCEDVVRSHLELSGLSPFNPADYRSALNGLRPTCLLSYA